MIGVLLFQDLAVVPLLVLIPALGAPPEATAEGAGLRDAEGQLSWSALLLFGGPRVMRWWLTLVARRRSEELFMLNLLLITLRPGLADRAGRACAWRWAPSWPAC